MACRLSETGQSDPVGEMGCGAAPDFTDVLRWKVLLNRAGGEGGIRTHDTVSRIHAFQACALSHSATSPERKIRQYSGRVFGYNPRPRVSRLAQYRRALRRGASHAAFASCRNKSAFSQTASPDGLRRGTIARAFRCCPRTERGEERGRHGSWAVVMAPRHSAPDHHFNMGAWRPSRLILPSGSSVAVRMKARH
jgi:hypothetical protein